VWSTWTPTTAGAVLDDQPVRVVTERRFRIQIAS
jgi:hypothetical protein